MEPQRLDDIAVILFRPKFSENVGSVARACANMGCSRIILVDPWQWDLERALPLATHHARHLLDGLTIVPTLREALMPFSFSYATTARLGGWRKAILTPREAAPRIVEERRHGGVALVFGPEDRGLTNEEIEICNECFLAAQERPLHLSRYPKDRVINHEEQELLFATLRETLMEIDYIKPDNPDYFMLSIKRFVHRLAPRRHEFNQIMGLCRQVRRLARLTRTQND
jgi:tRNA/rRNA methyltransferase